MRFKILVCGRAMYLALTVICAFVIFLGKHAIPPKEVFPLLAIGIVFALCYGCTKSSVLNYSIIIWIVLIGAYIALLFHSSYWLISKIALRTEKNSKCDVEALLRKLWQQCKVPFLSGIFSGALAYMWFLTNKIMNHDEIRYMFSKGADVTSGRWGLKLLEYIFPNFSMPWLWGFVSILLLSISACIIIKTFKIERTICKIVLSAAIVCFPSEIGTMVYMFTTSSYATSFLLGVLAMYLIRTRRGWYLFLALILNVMMMSIYQAYITMSSSLFVALLIVDLLDDRFKCADVLKESVVYLVFIGLSIGVYYIINAIIMNLSGAEYNNWALNALNDSTCIWQRVLNAFKKFGEVLLNGKYGIVRGSLSKTAHVAMIVLAMFVGIGNFSSNRDLKKKWMLIGYFCILLPLSINGLFILLGNNGIHTLTLFSYVVLYVVSVAVVDKSRIQGRPFFINLVSGVLAIITAGNITYANKIGLEQYMEYENTYSIYQSIVTQIQRMPEYNEKSKIAIIGKLPNSNYKGHFWNEEEIMGPSVFRNASSKDDFISYYLGVDLEYATQAEIKRILLQNEYNNMPEYPYYGYIRNIGDIIVVKLSE